MTIELSTTFFGGSAGLALVLLLVAVLPPAPVNLVAAIAQLDARDSDATGSVGHGRWWEHSVIVLTKRASRSTGRWFGLPQAELDLLQLNANNYVARRLAWAIGGIVFFGLFGVAVGLGLLAVPVAIFGAVACSAIPTALVRRAAIRARDRWQRAITAYLDLVAQERASGAAPAQAITEAASVADGQVFRRVQGTISHARRMGTPPWEALSVLGNRCQVTALVDLADIVSSAADGAAVYTTLTAKAAALRNATLNDDREASNKRSERLVGPLACLLIGFVILIMYPMIARL